MTLRLSIGVISDTIEFTAPLTIAVCDLIALLFAAEKGTIAALKIEDTVCM